MIRRIAWGLAVVCATVWLFVFGVLGSVLLPLVPAVGLFTLAVAVLPAVGLLLLALGSWWLWN